MGVTAAPRLTKFVLASVLVAAPLPAVTAPSSQASLPANAAPTPTPSSTTNAELAATIAPLKTTSHDVTMTTHDSTIKGSVEPSRHAASMVATAGNLRVDEVVDNGKIWLKMDLGADTNRQLGISKDEWMTLDPAKLTNANNLPIQPDGSDPIDMPGIINGVTSVTRTDPTHLKGTIDLSKVTGHNTPDPDAVRQAGDAAKSAPYAVTTDVQGRMTRFTVDTKSFDPSLSADVSYSNYGAASPITDPATSVEAPDSVYAVFS